MTTIYIGPYLVVPPSNQVTQQSHRQCSNQCDAPSISSSGKFCANCGGAITLAHDTVSKFEPIAIHKLADKWTDFMFCPEHGTRHPKGSIWLPNLKGSPGLHLSSDNAAGDVAEPIALSTMHPALLQAQAAAQYLTFVAALTLDFGIEPFWEVGIVTYAD